MLSPETIEALGRKEAKKARLSTIALLVIAVASIGILIILARL
jgi:hypothetical protein